MKKPDERKHKFFILESRSLYPMESVPANTIKSKPFAMLLGVLILVAIVTIAPHAFAQTSSNDSSDPHGSLLGPAWVAGMSTVGVVTGMGVYTTTRKH